MGSRPARFLIPALVTLVTLAIALFIFSFFGGKELVIGNLILRTQRGSSYPLQAPPSPVSTFTRRPSGDDLQAPEARNMILFIGDGMGLGHVSAASDLLIFPGGTLAMTDTEHVALVRTWVMDNLAPDSASAGTAFTS